MHIIRIIILLLLALASAFSVIERDVIPNIDNHLKTLTLIKKDLSKIPRNLLDSDTMTMLYEIDDHLIQANNNFVIANEILQQNLIQHNRWMWDIFLYQSLENAGLLVVLIVLVVIVYYKIKSPVIMTDIKEVVATESMNDIENQIAK